MSTRVKSLPDVVGLQQLRSLILVDCGISQLPLAGLDCLETLDVRRNRLRELPTSVGLCRRLRTVRLSYNVVRQLPSQLGQLTDSLTTLDCAFNRLKRLTTHLVQCTQLRSLQVQSHVIVSLQSFYLFIYLFICLLTVLTSLKT